MYAESLTWGQSDGWKPQTIGQLSPDLVLYFGSRKMLADGSRYRELRATFPTARLMGCTTGGQIHDNEIVDDIVNAIALRFDATKIRAVSEAISNASDSRRCGEDSAPTALNAPRAPGVGVSGLASCNPAATLRSL